MQLERIGRRPSRSALILSIGSFKLLDLRVCLSVREYLLLSRENYHLSADSRSGLSWSTSRLPENSVSQTIFSMYMHCDRLFHLSVTSDRFQASRDWRDRWSHHWLLNRCFRCKLNAEASRCPAIVVCRRSGWVLICGVSASIAKQKNKRRRIICQKANAFLCLPLKRPKLVECDPTMTLLYTQCHMSVQEQQPLVRAVILGQALIGIFKPYKSRILWVWLVAASHQQTQSMTCILESFQHVYRAGQINEQLHSTIDLLCFASFCFDT